MIKGVKQQTESNMYRLLEEQLRSGETKRSFFERHGIKPHIYHYWYRRYESQRVATGDTSLADGSGYFREIKREVSPSVEYFALIRDGAGRELVFGREVSAVYLKELFSW